MALWRSTCAQWRVARPSGPRRVDHADLDFFRDRPWRYVDTVHNSVVNATKAKLRAVGGKRVVGLTAIHGAGKTWLALGVARVTVPYSADLATV